MLKNREELIELEIIEIIIAMKNNLLKYKCRNI